MAVRGPVFGVARLVLIDCPYPISVYGCTQVFPAAVKGLDDLEDEVTDRFSDD